MNHLKLILYLSFGLFCTILASCHIPYDIRNTLNEATGDTLRVGISANPPWTILDKGQQPAGLEVKLIQTFAKKIDARIKWVKGTESNLLPQLEKAKLHILIAGLTTASPLVKHTGKAVYLKNKKANHVIAIPAGENAFLMRLQQFLHHRKTVMTTDGYRIEVKQHD